MLRVALLASTLLAAKPFFPYPLKTTVLKNGLTVVRVPTNGQGMVAYYTVMRVGSRNEPEAEHSGFAHFFEHMMFKGTAKWPEGTRNALLGKLGYSENAFTSDDVTVYHVYGPRTGLDQVIAVEADRFKNLDYAEPAFQTEAKAVLGEYHKNAANPGLKIEEDLANTAFTKHTYKHTTLGFYEDIKKMPGYYAYSREFFKRWYTPDNAIIFVVGDFDDAAAMKAIEANYSDWAGKSANVSIPVEPRQTGERSVHIDWATPTLPRVVHAWHTPPSSTTKADGAIQNVLSAYLAGPTSPLYKSMVLEKQLCETVGSGYFDHRDANLFTLNAVLKDEKSANEVKAAFDAAVADLQAGKVDARRVQDIKDNLRYSLLMQLETPDDVANSLAFYAGVLGSPTALDALYQRIAEVKPADLSAFAKKYLVTANRTVLTLTSKPATGGAK